MIGQISFCKYKHDKLENWLVGIIIETSIGYKIYDEDMNEQEEIFDYEHLYNFNLDLGLLMASEIAKNT